MTEAVVARDVFHLYSTGRGHVAALRGLTLDVAAGERVVVHGPNGSGKTTLMRVLAGEYEPSAGTVRVCGVDLAGAGERDRRVLRSTRLGLVDQHHGRALRPELSTVDNVALQLRLAGLGRVPARRRAGELLDRLGLAHLAGRPPETLSGGEAQQVAVCAAALLLVTHDVQATRIADRIVRIRDGRLSEEWTPADAGAESLVVDDRGWLRLPEPLRARTGVTSRVRADAGTGSIVLTPTAAAPDPEAPALAAAVAGPGPGAEVVARAEVTVRRGGRRLLDGVRLVLPAGSLSVVWGRSGSGKTTLLRVLAGLERPDAGTVEILGTDLAGLDRAGLARLRQRRVAVSAQHTVLLETLDVVENLELVRQARGLSTPPELMAHWLDLLGLAPLRHRPVRVLSGGERQRVGVARALVAHPAVALLDEPTSQQDETNVHRVVAVLAEAARRGTAVVAATHDPVLAEAAHAVLRLA